MKTLKFLSRAITFTLVFSLVFALLAGSLTAVAGGGDYRCTECGCRYAPYSKCTSTLCWCDENGCRYDTCQCYNCNLCDECERLCTCGCYFWDSACEPEECACETVGCTYGDCFCWDCSLCDGCTPIQDCGGDCETSGNVLCEVCDECVYFCCECGHVGDYAISTKEQFWNLRAILKDDDSFFAGKTITLEADIDFRIGSSVVNWWPVDLTDTDFDGKGHKIEFMWINLDAKSDSNVGLFGKLTNCWVQNFTIDKPGITVNEYAYWDNEAEAWVYVATDSYVGAVAGQSFNSVILGVKVEQPNIQANVSKTAFVGGIVGFSHGDIDKPEYAKVASCTVSGGWVGVPGFAYGTEGENPGSIAYVGGIAGAHRYALIGNSQVRNTEVFGGDNPWADGPEAPITLLCVGGIAGYTTDINEVVLGGKTNVDAHNSCLLNNLAIARIYVHPDIEASNGDGLYTGLYGIFKGGIAGYVDNDNVVSNVFIGDSAEEPFGELVNVDDAHLEVNNFAFATAQAALDLDVYSLLNDDTPQTGNLWILADLDVENDIEEAMKYYRLWRVDDSGVPYLGEYWAPKEAPQTSLPTVTALAIAAGVFAVMSVGAWVYSRRRKSNVGNGS
ncbi:MAG: hypothetical protein FWH20_07295 [Oscillospiraceae bacterium]|nr:hypothetical protein [Oscillospiraceae bacterium]